MSFKDSNHFKDFLDVYTTNPDRVIFFVGAGLSVPLFPSWSEFLKQLVIYTDGKGRLSVDKSELLTKIDKGEQFLDIADYCAEAIGRNEYRDIIERFFDKEFKTEDIPPAYLALLKLQFKGIITTNYDRIPEVGGKGVFKCYTNQNVSEALKSIERGNRIVIKIHGDILQQESIVLTQSEFKSIIHNNATVQNALRSIFSTSTVCFVGFGLSDPHFILLLEFLNSINYGRNIIHYAFLTGKTKFEIQAIERKTGIRVIEYDSVSNHIEVENFIRSLLGVESKPASTLITQESELLQLVATKLQNQVGLSSFFLRRDGSRTTVNYFSRARTEYELQRELISIFKIFDFDTKLVDQIKVCQFVFTTPDIEFTKFSPIGIVAQGIYTNSNKLANNMISEIDFWQTLRFSQPSLVGSLGFLDRQVEFPYLNY